MSESVRARDRFVRCEECGAEFVWTPFEQRQASSAAGGNAPRLCPGCRMLERRLLARVTAGVVKWFDRRKGFGFITAADGEDLFVRRNSLVDGAGLLRRGQRVTFQTRRGEKGPEAVSVRPAGAEAAGESPDAGE